MFPVAIVSACIVVLRAECGTELLVLRENTYFYQAWLGRDSVGKWTVYVCVCVCVCVCTCLYIDSILQKHYFIWQPKTSRFSQLRWYLQAPTRQLSFCLLVTVRISYNACKEYCKIEAVIFTRKTILKYKKMFQTTRSILGRKRIHRKNSRRASSENVCGSHSRDSDREGRLNFVNLYLRGLHNGETDRQTHTHKHTHILHKLENTSTLERTGFSRYSMNWHCMF
jgi:hypothetical protein